MVAKKPTLRAITMVHMVTLLLKISRNVPVLNPNSQSPFPSTNSDITIQLDGNSSTSAMHILTVVKLLLDVLSISTVVIISPKSSVKSNPVMSNSINVGKLHPHFLTAFRNLFFFETVSNSVFVCQNTAKNEMNSLKVFVKIPNKFESKTTRRKLNFRIIQKDFMVLVSFSTFIMYIFLFINFYRFWGGFFTHFAIPCTTSTLISIILRATLTCSTSTQSCSESSIPFWSFM